jgi:hypothetical protein
LARSDTWKKTRTRCASSWVLMHAGAGATPVAARESCGASSAKSTRLSQ